MIDTDQTACEPAYDPNNLQFFRSKVTSPEFVETSNRILNFFNYDDDEDLHCYNMAHFSSGCPYKAFEVMERFDFDNPAGGPCRMVIFNIYFSIAHTMYKLLLNSENL